MNYDSIIFDLDGTLWDSTEQVYEAWTEVVEAIPEIKHIPDYNEIMGVMGLPALTLMKKLFPELSDERCLEVFDACCDREDEILLEKGGKTYPELNETLEKLKNSYKLFIVSNCNKSYIDTYFESMTTKKYFTDWESHGATGLSKAENIKLVVKRNKLISPIYVGDTIWDKESATAAGVPFIHAAYGFGKVENSPEIDAPKELITLLGKE